MARTTLIALGCAVLTASASGNPIMPEYAIGSAGQVTINVSTGQVQAHTSRASMTVYRNMDTAIPGASVFAFRHGVIECGDDLNMIAGGEVESIATSIFNSASTAGGTPAPLLSVDHTLRIYTTSGGLPGSVLYTDSFNLDIVALLGAPLDPGFYFQLSFTGFSSLSLPSEVFATVQFGNAVGPTIDRVGQAGMNPIQVGTSAGTFYQGAGAPSGPGLYQFAGGAPPANFMWQTDLVPAPGPAVCLGIAGLVACRRRR